MAKHGIVALTRAFKFGEPKVYDTEGIKCFALAPWFADTVFSPLVSSKPEKNLLIIFIIYIFMEIIKIIF
jgi:hypothetical protein